MHFTQSSYSTPGPSHRLPSHTIKLLTWPTSGSKTQFWPKVPQNSFRSKDHQIWVLETKKTPCAYFRSYFKTFTLRPWTEPPIRNIPLSRTHHCVLILFIKPSIKPCSKHVSRMRAPHRRSTREDPGPTWDEGDCVSLPCHNCDVFLHWGRYNALEDGHTASHGCLVRHANCVRLS